MNDPGNYSVIADFGGIEKKLFFKVLGNEKEGIIENETINETITIEVEQTENITEINETENLTNKTGIEIDNKTKIKNISKIVQDENKTENAIREEQTTEEYSKFNYGKILFMIIPIITLLVLVVGAILVILILLRRK